MERSSKDFIAEAANMECSGRRGERKEVRDGGRRGGEENQ